MDIQLLQTALSEPSFSSPGIEKPSMPLTSVEDEETCDDSGRTLCCSKEDGLDGGFSSQDDEFDDSSPLTCDDEAEPIMASGSAQRTSSILKKLSDPLHISDSRRAWKCLPKPNMEVVRSASTPVEEDTDSSTPRNFNVSFGQLQVRSYDQTVGDNPSVSYGPPISLDWEYEEHDPICIDHYEDSRGKRRTLRQMILSYYHRRNILCWQYGVPEEELKKAKNDAKRTKYERSITATFLPVMKVEAALESAWRKATRLLRQSK
jgi:hypothetical protein